MSAILVLLALLSVATLASRQRYAAFLAHVVATPLLLAVGVMLSPRALGLFTASTQEAVLPAMRVGAAWLALLVGLRAARPRRGSGWAAGWGLTLLFSGMTWLGATAAAFATLVFTGEVELDGSLFVVREGRLDALGQALLLGGVITATGRTFAAEFLDARSGEQVPRLILFLSRHDDAVGALAVLAAVWLWPLPATVAPVYAEAEAAVWVVLGLGFTLFLAQAISQGGPTHHDPAGPQGKIALLGLLVFATGLSTSAALPEAAIAFFFGFFVAVAGTGRGLLEGLKNTERPVRLVVLILVGATLGFNVSAILVGVALAAARLLAKLIMRWVLSRGLDEPIPLAALLGSSGVAIPFILSFALSRPTPLGQSSILCAVCVAAGLSDLLTLVVWRRGPQVDEGEPAPTEGDDDAGLEVAPDATVGGAA